MKKAALCLALIWMAALLSTEAAAAKIVLKAGSAWPKTSPNVVDLHKYIELVNARAKGEVEIQWAGGPELIKAANLLDAASAGTVDIVQADPSYYAGIVKETGIVGLPVINWGWDKQIEIQNALKPKLDKIYQDRAGVKWLINQGMQRFYIVTGKFAVGKLEDMKGLKLRAGGGLMSATVTSLGAVPVNIPSEEVYMALQTGVVQGAFRGTASLISFKEYEHLHYLVNIPTYGVAHIWIGMNSWKKLSPMQQQVLLDSAHEVEQWSVGYYADMDTKGKAFLTEKGMTIRNFDPPEEARWRQTLAKGATEWYLKQGGAAGQELLDIILRYKR